MITPVFSHMILRNHSNMLISFSRKKLYYYKCCICVLLNIFDLFIYCGNHGTFFSVSILKKKVQYNSIYLK